MKKFILIILVLILNPLLVISQHDQEFRNLSKKLEQLKNINELDNLLKIENSKYKQTKDKFHLYNIKYIQAQKSSLYNDENKRLKQLIWITEDCPNCETEQLAWVNFHIASSLASFKSNLSIEYAQKSIQIAKKRKYLDIYPLSTSLLATIYYNNKKFEEGKIYFINAKENSIKQDTIFKASQFNNIGLCLMNMNKNKEAYFYFQKSLQHMYSIKNKTKESIFFTYVVEGNLGTILDRLGQFEKAITLLEKELAFYSQNKQWTECTNPAMELLDLYQKINNQSKEKNIVQRIQYLENLEINKKFAPILTEKLYNYFLKKGMNSETIKYSNILIKKMKAYSEKIIQQSNELNQILYYEKITQLKKESISNQKITFHAIRDKKQSQIISIISISGLLLMIAFAYISIREKTKRAKNEALILEQNRQIEINKNIILENEIQIQQEKITNMAMNLNIKKETEKAFLAKIKEIKKRKTIDLENIVKDLQMSVSNLLQIDEKMLHSTIETDVLNQKFKSKLASKHPELTKNDLNFCCYFRLNLSSKEIGALNQMSDISVRVLKNKIKNKMNLKQEESLNDYLIKITL